TCLSKQTPSAVSTLYTMPPKKKATKYSYRVFPPVSHNPNLKCAREEDTQKGLSRKDRRPSPIKNDGEEGAWRVGLDWIVPGRYKVYATDPVFEYDDYYFDLYWEGEGQPCHFYATFKFDKLVGIMRMRAAEKGPVLPFDKTNEHTSADMPGSTNKLWLMAWRGMETGMNLNRLVGGEEQMMEEFSIEENEDFDLQPTDTVEGKLGLKLKFVMLYNQKRFVFYAGKRWDLKADEIPTPPRTGKLWAGIDREWMDLYDPKWAIQSSSTPQQQHPIPAVIEAQPAWAFDMTGTWTIDTTNLTRDLSTFERDNLGLAPFTLEIKYANNPLQKKIGRQLWATFRWGRWIGCMRFCPGHTMSLQHLQFYKLCVLKKGVWAGPAPKGVSIWNFRWKAKDGEDIIPGSDEYETQIEFKQDANGTMRLDGKLVIGGYKARKFSGIKTGPLQSRKSNDTSVDGWWELLKDPHEESRQEICRGCKGNMEDSDEPESDREEVD
ncbi:hypothetical protein B0O99DRAFT_643742, partial [Bisporella sp. PMI_857]